MYISFAAVIQVSSNSVSVCNILALAERCCLEAEAQAVHADFAGSGSTLFSLVSVRSERMVSC